VASLLTGVSSWQEKEEEEGHHIEAQEQGGGEGADLGEAPSLPTIPILPILVLGLAHALLVPSERMMVEGV